MADGPLPHVEAGEWRDTGKETGKQQSVKQQRT